MDRSRGIHGRLGAVRPVGPGRRLAGGLPDQVCARLPEAARGIVAELLGRQPCAIRVTPPRRSKLGDHRPPGRGAAEHRITLNADLNPYAFLTTLLHELAHAITWERHRRRRVRPHGREWKAEFAALVGPIVALDLLPQDVRGALERSLVNPAAATCSDRQLALALARYDPPRPGVVRVEALAVGDRFRCHGVGVFRAGVILRSRRRCFTVPGGREYRFHCLAQVEPLPPPT